MDLCDRNAIYKAAEEVKKEVGKVSFFSSIKDSKIHLMSIDNILDNIFSLTLLIKPNVLSNR